MSTTTAQVGKPNQIIVAAKPQQGPAAVGHAKLTTERRWAPNDSNLLEPGGTFTPYNNGRNSKLEPGPSTNYVFFHSSASAVTTAKRAIRLLAVVRQ